MVSVGEDAPDFTAPLATGEITTFTLSERIGSGPVVLAFFPGAFSRVCTNELASFQDRLEAFEAVDATVYGISIDSPFVLNEFRDQLGLEFDLVSDADGEVIDAYDITMAFESYGGYDVAKRAVYVVDDEGTVVYAWVSDDPGVEPDYEETESAARSA